MAGEPLKNYNHVMPTYAPVHSDQPKCSQCGTYHPPVIGVCPMVSSKNEEDKDISDFLLSMTNIIKSQIDSKKIKNRRKLFSNLTVLIVKYIEQFKDSDNK